MVSNAGIAVVNKFLTFSIAVVLARYLGVAGYGEYTFAIALVTFVSVPAQLGLPTLVTREVAYGHARSDWTSLNGIRIWSRNLAVATTVAMILLSLTAWFFVGSKLTATNSATLLVSIALLPAVIALALGRSLLSGLRQVVHAAWPASIFQPTVLLSILAVYVFLDATPEAWLAMAANTVATVFAVGVTYHLIGRYWSGRAKTTHPTANGRRLLASLLPFSMIAGVNVVSQKTDVLMLGVLSGSEQIGQYNIAIQASLFVSFALVTLNTVLVPNIARLHANNDRARMQKLLTISTIGVSLFALLAAGTLYLLGEQLIVVLFGSDYSSAYPSLCILVAGQVVNALFGSVGYFLSMTGHEREALRALTVSAITNVILNFLLIPKLGASGAAIATACSLVIWNVVLGIRLFQLLRLVPGPFPVRIDNVRLG